MEAKHFDNDETKYFRLHIGCPVCLEHRMPTKTSLWVHGIDRNGHECGGDIYIGDNGYYYCDRCHEKRKIVNWAYKCCDPIHAQNTNDDYQRIKTNQPLANALVVANEITTLPEGLEWLNRLCIALLNQEEEAKNSEEDEISNLRMADQ